jgi:Fur family transcriptional regulator, ferric uptake regulator
MSRGSYPICPGEWTVERQDLRKAGLKVTSPRLKVLEMLENSDERHMTAEAIYRALLEAGEELGLATVYRVLTQFERAGLVTRHNSKAAPPCSSSRTGPTTTTWCASIRAKLSSSTMSGSSSFSARSRRHGYEIEEHSLVLYVRRRAATRATDDSARGHFLDSAARRSSPPRARASALVISTPPSMRDSSSIRSSPTAPNGRCG